VFHLSSDLVALADTCRILPRFRDFPKAIEMNLTGLEDEPDLAMVWTFLEGGDQERALEAAREARQRRPGAALLQGIVALQAGARGEAIDALEEFLADPPLHETLPGKIVFAFTDEGVIVFDVNALAGVGLLSYAYAVDGRIDDAIALAAEANAVTGAEGFLAVELILLRDEKRWEDLLRSAEKANPHDNGRFEIRLLCGRANEELGRPREALDIYADMARIDDFDLTWLQAARARIDDLPEGDAQASLEPHEYTDVSEDDDAVDLYDFLSPFSAAPTERVNGPFPQGAPPAAAATSRVFGAGLSLGGYLDGDVHVHGFAVAVHATEPPATWLALLEERSIEDVLDQLDKTIAAPVRLVGLRRRPDQRELAAKQWQTILAALLSAAAGQPDAPERLTRVLLSGEARDWVERLGFWTDAMMRATIGELRLTTRGGAESVIFPLVARLHVAGAYEAAESWLDWLDRGGSFPGVQSARAAVAFTRGDDDRVLTLTDGLQSRGEVDVAAQTFRARALLRQGRYDSALAVLNEAFRAAGRLDDDGDLRQNIRYLRARAMILVGRPARALDDLYAIEAVENDFLDVRELLQQLSRPQRGERRPIPREVKQQVWTNDGGRCAACGTDFDLQYDHNIPLAMGGSSNVENLQLLCGDCNRRKAATLG